MEKNYLVIAHHAPRQLKRLINSLNDGHSRFYIHIDRKVDINLFKELAVLEVVRFIEDRVDVIWGDFSQVLATLNMMCAAIEDNVGGFAILLSGQDYPIKSNQEINAFLDESVTKNFIDTYEVMVGSRFWNRRYRGYRIGLSSHGRHAIIIEPGFNIASVKHLLKRRINFNQFLRFALRKRKLNMAFHSGSQWWAMPMSSLKSIQTFVSHNERELFEFFRYTHCADEHFFQTVVAQLRKDGLKTDVEDSLTYVNWERKNTVLPVVFGVEDFSELKELGPEKLFARKFNLEADSEILDLIDRETGRKLENNDS